VDSGGEPNLKLVNFRKSMGSEKSAVDATGGGGGYNAGEWQHISETALYTLSEIY
jgi:hypothetical protein